MIPPADRHEQPSTAERRAMIEARLLAQVVLNAATGLERTANVGSLSVVWDTIAILLSVLRQEADARTEPWERIEDALNRDSQEWSEFFERENSFRNLKDER